jgi:hypothetical protein
VQGRLPLGWHGFIESTPLEGQALHHHGGNVCCVVLWLCVVVKLILYTKVPEHNLNVHILPYYKVNGVIFVPPARAPYLDPTPWEGQMAHHGDDVCGGSCVGCQWNFRTILTVQILRRGSFLFLPEPL